MAASYNHEVFVGLLIEAMDRRHLSQRRMARELGVSQQLVSKWMAGKTKPNPAVAVQLARLLDVSDLDVLRAIGYLPPEVGRPSPPPADDLETMREQIVELVSRVAELEEIVAAKASQRRGTRAAQP